MLLKLCRFAVTTDAVVWIEMSQSIAMNSEAKVTTDAVVWIEISNLPAFLSRKPRHHWCSGVDWNSSCSSLWSHNLLSPLMQWCGLKLMSFLPLRARRCHHWCSGVDWNAKTKFSSVISAGHHWCSGVDWNQSKRYEKRSSWVTTDAVVWIEISGTRIMTRRILVTTDAVVWIEIFWFRRWIARSLVTTDAVVWIEISLA